MSRRSDRNHRQKVLRKSRKHGKITLRKNRNLRMSKLDLLYQIKLSAKAFPILSAALRHKALYLLKSFCSKASFPVYFCNSHLSTYESINGGLMWRQNKVLMKILSLPIFITGIAFHQVGSLHLAKSRLTCCDFSNPAKFLIAGGHEKVIYVVTIPVHLREQIIEYIIFSGVHLELETIQHRDN